MPLDGCQEKSSLLIKLLLVEGDDDFYDGGGDYTGQEWRTNKIPTGGSQEINFHFVNFPTLFILSSVGQDRYPNT